jgi:hypothetical protein
MSDDPLSVQVSFRVRKPKGVELSRSALNDIYLEWVKTGDLPPNIEIRGIFWKNSARHGKLNYWRYSKNSDLSVMIKDWKNMTSLQKSGARERYKIEDSPRGDHELARETLQGALATFRPF